MKVSAKAEYACIALLELAASFGEAMPVRLKNIADQHGIPQRFLVQILLQLKGAGLVASVRGASGGYQLTKKPEDITLAEVINLIDRSPAPRPVPLASPNSAAVEAVRSLWQEVHAAERQVLENVTLADLVRRTMSSSTLSYQI